MHKGKTLLLKKAKDELEENIGKWECCGKRLEKKGDFEHKFLEKVYQETELSCEIKKDLAYFTIRTTFEESKCHVYLLTADKEQVTLSEEHLEYN